MVHEANDQTFNDFLKTHERVVVKFFAGWCGTCRLFAPKFKKMSEKEAFSGVTFLDVNAEENPVTRKLAGVTNLPHFAVFKNGQLIATESTAKEEGVENLIHKLF